MSSSLGVSPSNIEVIDYYEGSVIVLYNLVESLENPLELQELQTAYEEKILKPVQGSSEESNQIGGFKVLSI